jgi:hypothetical protein
MDRAGLISRLMERQGVIGFDYRDERTQRSPTGHVRDLGLADGHVPGLGSASLHP